jgi:hypothetical protein
MDWAISWSNFQHAYLVTLSDNTAVGSSEIRSWDGWKQTFTLPELSPNHDGINAKKTVPWLWSLRFKGYSYATKSNDAFCVE